MSVGILFSDKQGHERGGVVCDVPDILQDKPVPARCIPAGLRGGTAINAYKYIKQCCIGASSELGLCQIKDAGDMQSDCELHDRPGSKV